MLLLSLSCFPTLTPTQTQTPILAMERNNNNYNDEPTTFTTTTTTSTTAPSYCNAAYNISTRFNSFELSKFVQLANSLCPPN